ncbi:hypothetical protein C6353_23945 [Bacillus toyonensis]|uniref:hypothetical protein n=1 Tax=Bacillus toyonensis TaxID=155322 RepID=UPI000D023DBC|nr:hypothetical protein [Bacillus toyonensis]PRT14495.1 hypothetical protein C6353_23945 [Bacillus toyonensis]
MSGVRELDEYRNKRINNNGGDGEMSNFATLKDLEHVEEKMSSKLENLEEKIGSKLENLEEKMGSKLENLEEKIGSKLENLEEKMGSKLENLEEKMDHKLELTEKNIEIMFLKEREYHRKNKIDSIKWIVGTGIGIVGLVFTYLKFFAS